MKTFHLLSRNKTMNNFEKKSLDLTRGILVGLDIAVNLIQDETVLELFNKEVKFYNLYLKNQITKIKNNERNRGEDSKTQIGFKDVTEDFSKGSRD